MEEYARSLPPEERAIFDEMVRREMERIESEIQNEISPRPNEVSASPLTRDPIPSAPTKVDTYVEPRTQKTDTFAIGAMDSKQQKRAEQERFREQLENDRLARLQQPHQIDNYRRQNYDRLQQQQQQQREQQQQMQRQKPGVGAMVFGEDPDVLKQMKRESQRQYASSLAAQSSARDPPHAAAYMPSNHRNIPQPPAEEFPSSAKSFANTSINNQRSLYPPHDNHNGPNNSNYHSNNNSNNNNSYGNNNNKESAAHLNIKRAQGLDEEVLKKLQKQNEYAKLIAEDNNRATIPEERVSLVALRRNRERERENGGGRGGADPVLPGGGGLNIGGGSFRSQGSVTAGDRDFAPVPRHNAAPAPTHAQVQAPFSLSEPISGTSLSLSSSSAPITSRARKQNTIESHNAALKRKQQEDYAQALAADISARSMPSVETRVPSKSTYRQLLAQKVAAAVSADEGLGIQPQPHSQHHSHSQPYSQSQPQSHSSAYSQQARHPMPQQSGGAVNYREERMHDNVGIGMGPLASKQDGVDDEEEEAYRRYLLAHKQAAMQDESRHAGEEEHKRQELEELLERYRRQQEVYEQTQAEYFAKLGLKIPDFPSTSLDDDEFSSNHNVSLEDRAIQKLEMMQRRDEQLAAQLKVAQAAAAARAQMERERERVGGGRREG